MRSAPRSQDDVTVRGGIPLQGGSKMAKKMETKKLLKRMFSVFLALVMAVPMVAVTPIAATATDVFDLSVITESDPDADATNNPDAELGESPGYIDLDADESPIVIDEVELLGIRAYGSASVDESNVFVTANVQGAATHAGVFIVRAWYDEIEIGSASYPLNAGEVLTRRSFVTDMAFDSMAFDSPETLDDTLLTLSIQLIPDLTTPPVNNVSATGRLELYDNSGTVTVTMSSPNVGREGFYRVSIEGTGFTTSTPFQMERYAFRAAPRSVLTFELEDVDMAEFGIDMELHWYASDSFFYIINYANETISFGETFGFPRLDPETPAVRNPDGTFTLPRYLTDSNNALVWGAGNRGQITFIFNRRADRIRVDRGSWVSTITGETCIRRHLNRGGFLGVRQAVGGGRHELIAIIPLDARPINRNIRPHRRIIYRPTMMLNNEIERRDYIWNPEAAGGEYIEVRIGNDRGVIHSGFLATERLAPQERFALSHDGVPRGTRGAYRIAPTEATNFLWHNGNFTSVQELLWMGVAYCDNGTPIVPSLLDGNFGSPIVRFRIPNQPNAPAIARVAVTPGRNGAAMFLGRTNANMQVKVGYETDPDLVTSDNPQGLVLDWDGRAVPVWRQMGRNITVRDFIDLFEDDGFILPRRGIGEEEVYEFEIRTIRNNRIASVPAFFSWPTNAAATALGDGSIGFREATNITAFLRQGSGANPVVSVTGTQHDPNERATLYRSGSNVFINTNGASITVANNTDVSSWFTNMPDGLTARVTQVTGGHIRVNIRGRATEALNAPIEVTIPAGYLTPTAFVITPNPNVVFNIAPAPPTPYDCDDCDDAGCVLCCAPCVLPDYCAFCDPANQGSVGDVPIEDDEDLPEDPSDVPADDPEDDSVNDPADDPEDDSANDPADDPEDDSSSDPSDAPEDDSASDPSDAPEGDSASDPSDTPADDSASNSASDPADNSDISADSPADNSAPDYGSAYSAE